MTLGVNLTEGKNSLGFKVRILVFCELRDIVEVLFIELVMMENFK